MIMNILLVIFDGLGDRPIKELEDKTPLEAAHTPNMDFLAKNGITGLMYAVDRGVRPGSDTSHLSIFGYDPYRYYTGRGPFEAAGIGMELLSGDIALRANFGTVENGIVIDRRAGRIDDTEQLCNALNGIEIDNVKFLVKKGTGHRAALVLRGKNITWKISDQDPHKENVPLKMVKPLDSSNEAKRTADILNLFSQKAMEILENHPLNAERKRNGLLPANCLLFRGAGIKPEIESFQEKYHMKAACIAGGGLYKGIARVIGMDVVEVPGATGKGDTNLSAKVKAAIDALKKYDFVFLHIKWTDSLSEDGKFMEKKKFIESADTCFEPLTKLTNTLIAITGDHSTPCTLKQHSADPVPILISGPGVRIDDVKNFGERYCAKGGLGIFSGKYLMPEILNITGRSSLFGN